MLFRVANLARYELVEGDTLEQAEERRRRLLGRVLTVRPAAADEIALDAFDRRIAEKSRPEGG